MTFPETTTQGWFGRLGNAIVGVLVGLVFIPLSIVLVFWNEGRAVHTARTLEEGKSIVITVDSARASPANDGKLLHFTAKAISASGDQLVDPMFHISADAFHLRRNVLMYEWVEEKHTETRNNAIGGGETKTTTYSYSKEWKDQPIDSTQFRHARHKNPAKWRVAADTLDAPTVSAGAFQLNAELVGKIDNFTPIELSPDLINGLGVDLKNDAVYASNAVLVPNEPGQKPDLDTPRVGDMKVTFEAALPGNVSVIAK